MSLHVFYTMVQKSQKMTKNSNQGGPALTKRSQRLQELKQANEKTLKLSRSSEPNFKLKNLLYERKRMKENNESGSWHRRITVTPRF